jgi:phosphopantetheinyl transferase (holo-ACP synthase)
MIGNDVIDLELALRESNWKRKGWIEKIFTGAEQQWIYSFKDRDKALWTLWSMKESAYKIYNRTTGARKFNPHALVCSPTILNSQKFGGMVAIGKMRFYTETNIIADRINTIASAKRGNLPFIKSVENLSGLIKVNGLPFYQNNAGLFVASKSDHGRFLQIIYLSDSEPGLQFQK